MFHQRNRVSILINNLIMENKGRVLAKKSETKSTTRESLTDSSISSNGSSNWSFLSDHNYCSNNSRSPNSSGQETITYNDRRCSSLSSWGQSKENNQQKK